MIDRAVVDSPLLEEAALPYLGQWNLLVSTTNWEKGRIIFAWREAMIAADAPPSEYADDAWSRRVGNVTGQHVGRLRRVFERFGESRNQYPKLFWSHFQAALDWDDAEMWLEGAAQSRWSISEMRRQRWQALGAPDDLKPRDEDIIVGEIDEDSLTAEDGDDGSDSMSVVRSPARQTSEDDGEEVSAEGAGVAVADFDADAEDAPFGDDEEAEARAAVEPVRPFANLAELPDDLSEAFESYKLAILRHKLAGWTEITQSDLVASLDALKALALAPPSE